MFLTQHGYLPCVIETETGIDAGSENFGFKDQKGRECGFRWRIVHFVLRPLTEAEYNAKALVHYFCRAPHEPLDYFELTTSPMRDGSRYGPAFNSARTETLEQARQTVVRRASNARKRDAKKFTQFNAA